ncbi:hypothetical protein [Streptomyces sp. YKOK-I1]
MRHAVGAMCMVVGLGLLSGCSPADLPLVAVWTGTDGKPVAEVRLCAGDQASDVTLHSWGEHEYDDAGIGDDEPSATPSSTMGSGVEDSGWMARVPVRGSTSFPLFSPPPTWQVETTGPQALLPGRTYALTFTGPRGWDPYDGHVYFTADDLASLGPGQVWAHERAMNRNAFDELVDDKC